MATKWEAIENGKRWAIFPAGPLGEAHILSVSTTAFDQEGIARLAAAAPGLLAALKSAPDFGGDPTTAFGREFREWQKIARAAIAKAEGAQ